jgi:hypothetical protein
LAIIFCELGSQVREVYPPLCNQTVKKKKIGPECDKKEKINGQEIIKVNYSVREIVRNFEHGGVEVIPDRIRNVNEDKMKNDSGTLSGLEEKVKMHRVTPIKKLIQARKNQETPNVKKN